MRAQITLLLASCISVAPLAARAQSVPAPAPADSSAPPLPPLPEPDRTVTAPTPPVEPPAAPPAPPAEAAPQPELPPEPAVEPPSVPLPAAPPSAPSTSLAETPPDETLSPDAPSERRWYGPQIWMVDAGAVAAFGAGAALHSSAGSTSTAFYVTGFFGYWLGPAVVHTVHGHFKKAAASAGLRFVAPLLGLGAGAAFSACSDRRRCDEAPIWLGLVTGVVAGSVLDAAALAYDEKPTPKASLGRVMPMLAPLPHGLQIGLVGTLDAE